MLKYRVYKDPSLEYVWLKMYVESQATDKDEEYYARVKRFVKNRKYDMNYRIDVIDDYDAKIGYKNNETYSKPQEKINSFLASMMENKQHDTT